MGAQTFVADNGGVDLSTVSGMTSAGGNVLYGSTADGALRSVALGSGGISGGPSVVSDDGSWTVASAVRAERLTRAGDAPADCSGGVVARTRC